MNSAPRSMSSEYMEWAKLHSTAPYNLATSGIMSVPGAEFSFDGMPREITGPGGYGYQPLQERIARHAGVAVECVVAAAGTSMANHLALAAVLSPGDEVIIEEPAYGPLLEVGDYVGATTKRIARPYEREFAIDVSEVESAFTSKTRLIVLTNMHNPTGALLGAETLRALGELALQHRAHVLVDEVYLEMLFADDVPWSFAIGRSLAGVDENPFIVTNSLTKGYGLSGLRCGWIVAAPKLAHRISRLNDLFGANAAHPAEQLSAVAFDHLPEFRARAQTLLATNRPILDAFLKSRGDLEYLAPPAGTVVFPRHRRGDSNAFAQVLREKYETSVVPGRFFEMPQHFRIGIGGDTGELREGLSRLGAALDEFSG